MARPLRSNTHVIPHQVSRHRFATRIQPMAAPSALHRPLLVNHTQCLALQPHPQRRLIPSCCLRSSVGNSAQSSAITQRSCQCRSNSASRQWDDTPPKSAIIGLIAGTPNAIATRLSSFARARPPRRPQPSASLIIAQCSQTNCHCICKTRAPRRPFFLPLRQNAAGKVDLSRIPALLFAAGLRPTLGASAFRLRGFASGVFGFHLFT